MVRVTLDHNCIIDLEEARPAAVHISGIVAAHRDGHCQVRLVAIGASERLRGGSYATSIKEFELKVAAVGLGDLELIKPMSYWGICFWGWALWVGPSMRQLERNIHEVLFLGIEFEFADFVKSRGIEANNPTDASCRAWRNAKCDVQALWSHIYHAGDIFVTSDSNYTAPSKRPRLVELGSGEILTPVDALGKLQASPTA